MASAGKELPSWPVTCAVICWKRAGTSTSLLKVIMENAAPKKEARQTKITLHQHHAGEVLDFVLVSNDKGRFSNESNLQIWFLFLDLRGSDSVADRTYRPGRLGSRLATGSTRSLFKILELLQDSLTISCR